MLSDKILAESYDWVLNLLNENIDLLREMTTELVKRSALFKEDVLEIIGKHKLI